MIVEQITTVDKQPAKPRIRLECDNRDYHFVLTKAKEDVISYALVDYKPKKRGTPLVDQGGFGIHTQAFSYVAHVVSACEGERGYVVRGLRLDEKTKFAQLDFSLPIGDKQMDVRVLLDPGRDWCILKRSLETPSAVGVDEWEYGERVGGLTFPTRHTNRMSYKVANAPPNLLISARLISIILTDKTSDDFRLTAFGLPEPVGMPIVNRSGTRWYVWLTLAAVLVLAAGVVVHKVRRRYESS